jgi:hypothetical protein
MLGQVLCGFAVIPLELNTIYYGIYYGIPVVSSRAVELEN